MPESCDNQAEPGDHLLLRWSMRDAASSPESPPIFTMNSWEQQHFELGHADTPQGLNDGLVGMCAGERRRLTMEAAAFDVSGASAPGVSTIVADVELITLTTSGDHHIFTLIDKVDVAGIMEMIDGHAGVNAVDRMGNSALMASVQGGARLQMAVATILNSWRPKADVDFQKPSGHSVLFYAASQDDKDGNTVRRRRPFFNQLAALCPLGPHEDFPAPG